MKSQFKYDVSLLAFGRLGESARLSFESIASLDCASINVMGDTDGIEWCVSLAKELKVKVKIHMPERINLEKAGIYESAGRGYSTFGSDHFMRLTAFKWDVIRCTLQGNPSSFGVLFTDLDVIWVKEPQTLLANSFDIAKFMSIQKDSLKTNGGGKPHYCTGVMFWKNCKESVDALKMLFNMQLEQNLERGLRNDEQVFNRWLNESDFFEKVEALPSEKFVIGHRYFQVLLNKGFDSKEINCFHANYVIGESRKLNRLFSIKARKDGRWVWLACFILEVHFWLISKISNSYRILAQKSQ
jgi:hypothetical protein